MAQFFPEQLVAWCDTLAAVLAHSLWQGLLISVAVWIVLRTVPTRYSNLRYAAALGGLATVVLAVFVTWTVLQLPIATANQPIPSTARISTEPPPATNVVGTTEIALESNGRGDSAQAVALEPTGSPTGTNRTTPKASESTWLQRLTPTIVTLWLIGVCVMLVRTTGAVVRWQRWMAREVGVSPLDLSELESLLAELSTRLKLRQVVKLVVCDQVDVPAVLGMLWPAILIPPAMVTGIPAEQWRIILAHELAHVRRYDNLVNLVQMLIESLFFFNPAVWWISRQVRVEREVSCDALAAEVAGKPVSVARTLIDVARSLREGSTAAVPLPMTALAETRHAGSLTDRVRRLLHPNAASRPKLTGSGLFLALLVVVATGAALQQGTDLAVRTAAELMSPKERIDTLARLQAEQGGVFVGPGSSSGKDQPAANQGADDTAESGKESRKIKVTVHVRTDDGAPLPEDLVVYGYHHTGNSSGSTALGYSGREAPEFSASHSFPPCRLVVAASATGYAPTISELQTLFLEEGDREFELVLTRGFTTKLRMIDEQGEPVPDAWVRATLAINTGAGWSTFNQRNFTSDADGLVVIDHASPSEYQLDARVAGFQHANQRLTLSPEQTVDWTMSTARPTAVRVVDSAGTPVPEAKLLIFSWKRGQHGSTFNDPRSWTGHVWNLYGETDQAGRTVLDELRDDRAYRFGVLASEFGLQFLEDVTAGEEEQIVTLKPPLRVTGRLTGALDRLQTRKQEGRSVRCFGYRNDLKFGDSGYSDYFYANVDEDGRFELPNLVPGTVELGIPGNLQRLKVQQSMIGLEFEIPEKDPAEAPIEMRDVVVRLTGTSPSAPARGNIFVSGQGLGRFAPGNVPIVDNEVRVRVPLSAKLWIEARDVVGYTFDERRHGEYEEVVAGEGPQIIELATRPAGAVHGRVLRPDGSEAEQAFVQAFAMKVPDGMDEQTRFNGAASSGGATFFRSLPLGGRYRLVAREVTDTAARWAVSDEFVLDKSHPIEKVDLRLQEGRTVTVRVVDNEGRMMEGVDVELWWSLGDGHHSSSASVVRRTAKSGIARFENVGPGEDVGSLTLNAGAKVAPQSGCIGWQGELEELPGGSSADYEIRRQRGVSASGVVLDSATGRPIPNAPVRVYPVDFGAAAYKANVHTTTNERGEFHFDNLERIQYWGHVDGTMPKGTVVTPFAGSGYRFSYPNGPTEHRLRGGSGKVVEWEVTILPNSRLRPLPAE